MDKKEVIKAVEEKLGTKAKYKGAPTFSYEITDGKTTYTVTRTGEVLDMNGVERLLECILNSDSTEDEITYTERELMRESPSNQKGAIEVSLQGHSGATIRNLINMLTSKQKLLALALGLDWQPVGAGVAEELAEAKVTDLKELEANLGPLKPRLKGFQINLSGPVPSTEFSADGINEDKVKALREVLKAAANQARQLKYASYKASQDDNPKYALRVWLIRLGLNGAEHKETRATLLKGLEGNSAFRGVEPKIEK
ncbi:hypothetical protein [Youngiibacter multivorans]|uniref:Virulence-related protein n=1 Tax=Youngiibacter multivorans TaxID=937251 RepID=A0ABS4G757_9CLOT|nr:hypothetical protein [Youngiibacter multivorans]MBP1920392.1 hypothetical protein [Youngiibacter multivorans]